MTGPELLDLALLLVLLVQAVRGWQLGVLTRLLGLAGAVGGVWLGLWLGPLLLARFAPDAEQRSLGFVVLLLAMALAGVGQSIGSQVAHTVRRRSIGRHVGLLDQVLGLIASVVVTSLLVTTVASALRPALPHSWGTTMNSSRLLPRMEQMVPDGVERWAGRLTHELTADFPRVFSGLEPEPVLPVPAPDSSAAQTPGVRRASGSIIKVLTDARACNQTHAGSGWVVAPQRVVTNAHVVAGSGEVSVQVGGLGRRLGARVVAFNPDLDLAILDVPALAAPALKRAPALAPRQDAVVAGFPGGGQYTLNAARVRGSINASGDDIYGGKGVVRQVYALNTTVRPGNSGGPLLTTDGRVAGTIFARSSVDPKTGYALTDGATDAMLDAASRYRNTVPTQGCALS